MKVFSHFLFCVISVFFPKLLLAREFINSGFEVQLSYSHFNQMTVFAGKIDGTLRRTDDHFACALTVNNQVYDCKTKASIDKLNWVQVELADYLKIVLSSINAQLPKETIERITVMLQTHLAQPMLLTGVNYTFKNRVQMYDEDIPDVLDLTVKIGRFL